MKQFKKVFVEITTVCNLRCPFCHPTARPPAFISVADFAVTLERLQGWTEHINLHLLGEPLLHPELDQLLSLSHQHRLRVNLTTNTTLLGERRDLLLSSPALRQLNLSLHSRALHPGDPSPWLTPLLAFVDAARTTTPLWLSLRLWNLAADADPARTAVNRLIRRRLEEHFARPAPLPEQMTPGQGVRLAPQVFLSQEEEFTWPGAATGPARDRGSCRALRDHIGVLVDGTVVPCCLDADGELALGNLHRQSLDEILATPRAVALRDGFARQRLVADLCRRCTYCRRFAKS